VIAFNEVCNAIQNGVIEAGENEAASFEKFSFYEVAQCYPDGACYYDPSALLFRQDVQGSAD
jgi:TRAP-type C4-dicarboxylate transport system substrate-binding protein